MDGMRIDHDVVLPTGRREGGVVMYRDPFCRVDEAIDRVNRMVKAQDDTLKEDGNGLQT